MKQIYSLFNRIDLIQIANRSRFTLQHYAKGFFPVSMSSFSARSVNRIFFPLKNQGGRTNFIRDHEYTYPLRTDRMYFIPSCLPTSWELDDRLEFLSIHANLMPFPGIDLFSGCSKMLELERPWEFHKLLDLFDTSSENDIFSSLRAYGLVYSMLINLFPLFEQSDFWKPLIFRNYANLIEYLQKYGTAGTSVSDLAEIMEMTRETFTRHFTGTTHTRPKEFIDRFLIAKSMDLLHEGLSIKEAADCLHFSSQFAFSRFFKRYIGFSPLEWRKQGLQNQL